MNMDELGDVPIWDSFLAPHVVGTDVGEADPGFMSQSSWEDLLNGLLVFPDDVEDTTELGQRGRISAEADDMLRLPSGGLIEDGGNRMERTGGGVASVDWMDFGEIVAAPVGTASNDAGALGPVCYAEYDIDLPGLVSEGSSLASGQSSDSDCPKSGPEFRVISPGACSTDEGDFDEIAAAPVEAVSNRVGASDLGYYAFPMEENVGHPSVLSGASSLAGCRSSGSGSPKSSFEACGISPGASSADEADERRASSSEVRVVSSPANSRVFIRSPKLKRPSPDTGSDSSDVGAMGRSCDNFGDELQKGVTPPDSIDEDAKRQSRLMRNRESATQSRLRKKSYMKELEVKCIKIENQLSMLHQTLAFTSQQNIALTEEVTRLKCLVGNGSMYGSMEPAALPSDSLPPESPSRHTYPCRLDNWELVAFLCHVLLLLHLQTLALELVQSAESTPSKARNEGRGTIQRFGRVSSQVRTHFWSAISETRKFSSRRKRKSLRIRRHIHFSKVRSGTSPSKRWRTVLEKLSPKRRKRWENRTRRHFSRSQYSSLYNASCYCYS